jgi:hypothetical protein
MELEAALSRLEQAGAGWANKAVDAVREGEEDAYPPEGEAYREFIAAIRDAMLALIETPEQPDRTLRERLMEWPKQYLGDSAESLAAPRSRHRD